LRPRRRASPNADSQHDLSADGVGHDAEHDAETPGRVEGVVRQVNSADGRVVIETDRREMITVRGTATTPVYYRNTVYRISNLEPGDRSGSSRTVRRRPAADSRSDD
jgi:hypothetical protein